MTKIRTARILVVDDDYALRETIGRCMRRAGHFVVTAENGQTALGHSELGRAPFDVVVTDVHMPGMTGLDLATALIERRPTQRVVIITGDPDEALARAALARGPVSYLLKPFELFELESAVKRALALPRYSSPRPPASGGSYNEPAIGTVPAEWLLWVDDRSNAGSGHADRVARMARIAALSMAPPVRSIALAELEVAAWSHEIGLLAGPTANPVEMAWRSAQMLEECGSSERIISLVRHMHERWDGSGGPDRLSADAIPIGSQILAAVDAIDHYSAAWIQTGMHADLAAHRAIGLVLAQQTTCFSPVVGNVLAENRDTFRSVCGVVRRQRADDFEGMPRRDIPLDLNTTLEAIAS